MKYTHLFIFLIAFALTACHPNSQGEEIGVDLINNPNSADGYNADQPMPIMAFDCDLHDFGRISQGESITYSFHFVNKGKSDLIISGCSATCGCTVADYPRKRIAPGDDGYVTVTCTDGTSVRWNASSKDKYTSGWDYIQRYYFTWSTLETALAGKTPQSAAINAEEGIPSPYPMGIFRHSTDSQLTLESLHPDSVYGLFYDAEGTQPATEEGIPGRTYGQVTDAH